MAPVLAAAGLVLLFLGGEFVVRGGVALSARLGVPRLLIGLVVVGFATSLPELVVSLSAAIGGEPAITVGNIVGSTNANLLLILGASAAIAPLMPRASADWVEAVAMTAAVAALAVAALLGGVSRLAGVAFVAALVAYLVFAYVRVRTGRAVAPEEPEFEEAAPMPLGRSAALVGAGLVALVAGGQTLVAGAVTIARQFGVPEAVIGLTLVAVGTSLPELATTIVAAVRGHGEIAVGNVLGSNLFNVLGILGLTAVVRPLPIGPDLLVDTAVAVAASLLLFPLLVGRRRLTRMGGGVLLAAYFAYVVLRLT